MKKLHLKYLQSRFGYRSFALFLAVLFGLSCTALSAQEEAKEQLRSRMSLSAVQGDENRITLKALARAKIDGRYTGLPGLEVAFFSKADSLEKELGKAKTNEGGIASLSLPKSELYIDTSGAFFLMAVFEGNEDFRSSDDEMAITAAKITLEGLEEDSIRTLDATLESNGTPVAETDIYFFVKGTFRPLKIGEATTDEEGKASVDFPMGLPGGPDGKVNIIARLEDDDTFGTVEANLSKSWGEPVEMALDASPRELWSPDPPLWLLLTFIILLLIIWGHYLEVIYKLFQLRKKAVEH